MEKVVTIYNENGWFRNLFELPETEEKYIGSGTVWYDYRTGKRVSSHKEREILNIIMKSKINALNNKKPAS